MCRGPRCARHVRFVQVLGPVDAAKLRSSMTLFERAAGADTQLAGPFVRVLERFYDGRRDDATLGILGA